MGELELSASFVSALFFRRELTPLFVVLLDSNRDGKINFEEFTAMVAHTVRFLFPSRLEVLRVFAR